MDVKNIQKLLFNKEIIPFKFWQPLGNYPCYISVFSFSSDQAGAFRSYLAVSVPLVPWSCGLNGGLSRRGDGRNKNDERWMQNKDEKRQVYSIQYKDVQGMRFGLSYLG